MRSRRLLIFTATLVVSLACGANAITYSLRTLGTLGGSDSYALGVSNNGIVVGTSTTATGALHAFIWQNGVMRDLDTMGTSYSRALGVNSSGEAVGYFKQGLMEHACIWRNGQMIDLDNAASSGTVAAGISESGDIIGWFTHSTGVIRWHNDVAENLGTFGGQSASGLAISDDGHIAGDVTLTQTIKALSVVDGTVNLLPGVAGGYGSDACDINNSGVVAGYYRDSSQVMQAAMWRGTTLTDLGVPNSAARAINNRGQILIDTVPIPPHGYLWDNGVIYSFGDRTMASDINDNGWVVGTTNVNAPTARAALWTPVPEPASVLVLLAGIGGMASLLRRQRMPAS